MLDIQTGIQTRLSYSENVKLVIFVPSSHSERIKETLSKLGAGCIGNYDSCSYSLQGLGRFRPLSNAKPTIGKVGDALVEVIEERIECICKASRIAEIIKQVQLVHPYEEMGYDIYPLLQLKSRL